MSLAAPIGSGLPFGPFRIDVDEPHLHGAQQIVQLAFAAIALIAKPGPFGTPVELFRLPHVGAAASETECLETR